MEKLLGLEDCIVSAFHLAELFDSILEYFDFL